MRLRGKDIKGLPVETRSGTPVGRVQDVVIDAYTHRAVQYVVKKAHSLAKILPAEMLVNVGQVVYLDDERMVVEDGVVGEEAKAEPLPVAKERPAGAASPVTRTSE